MSANANANASASTADDPPSQVDRLIYARAWPVRCAVCGVRCAACAGAGALHCALAFASESDCTDRDARADGSSAASRRGARRLGAGQLIMLPSRVCCRRSTSLARPAFTGADGQKDAETRPCCEKTCCVDAPVVTVRTRHENSRVLLLDSNDCTDVSLSDLKPALTTHVFLDVELVGSVR